MDSDRDVLCEFIGARLNRAGDHLDELRRDVESLVETDRARVVTELSADKRQVFIYLMYRRPHPNRRWGAIIGDFTHCLRSALNNTVYAIALTCAGCFPPPDNNWLAFPIADTGDDWKKVKSRIRSLPEDARVVIEAVQPCQGGDSILSALGSFNNADKHRLPEIAAGAMVKGKIAFSKPPDGRLVHTAVLNGPAITHQPSVILTFSEPQVSKPHVLISLSSRLFLQHGGTWHPAFEALEEMKRQTESVIELLKPFIRS